MSLPQCVQHIHIYRERERERRSNMVPPLYNLNQMPEQLPSLRGQRSREHYRTMMRVYNSIYVKSIGIIVKVGSPQTLLHQQAPPKPESQKKATLGSMVVRRNSSFLRCCRHCYSVGLRTSSCQIPQKTTYFLSLGTTQERPFLPTKTCACVCEYHDTDKGLLIFESKLLQFEQTLNLSCQATREYNPHIIPI